MLKIIFNRVVKRLFPNRSMQSLTKSEILRAENEAIQIMNRTKGKTGEVIDLTGRRIDTSQPIMGGKNVESINNDLKIAEFLKIYTKDGQPNDVELNALANEHRILSAEAKKLGDAGENYEKFSQLNKRTDEIQEIIEFMRKEFPEDMASGGIARVGYAAGKIVKGASWVIKSLKKSRKEVIEGTGRFKNLNSMQQDLLKKELSALIKQLEQGGAIPDDMLKTMRQDKRFKDIVKTPSTDPELRELEEVLLDHRKQELLDDWEGEAWDSGRDVVDSLTGPKEIKKRKQIEMLKDFDTTGRKKNASGGLAQVLGV